MTEVRRIRFWAIPLALLFSSIFAGVALANNVHTVGEWYHGLGDGSNSNNYVHPFNENTAGHVHCNTIELFSSGTKKLGTLSCSTTHHHADWDTSPNNECSYWSRHEATGTHPLNLHSHVHDSYCG